MEPDADRKTGWYIIPSALKVPENGEAIRYQISVFDIDGYEATSDTVSYTHLTLPTKA